ncbi:glycosyltransferase family A protein [Pannus brasiliensis CCIBt3594]|uniref:Glycosyltransferase family A protein n=1 Tax=Pannus brasiliensis CCIBt3594 TaxID=1427578 RepID=A0AAW9QSA2_9CHRO
MRDEGITVVITCFREGALIYEAIESVKNQTRQPREIILVNDASIDRSTNEVCRELERDPMITVIWRERNGGPSIARNDGIERASGEIIVPLDADDILPIDALDLIGNTFQKYPDAGFVYGNYCRQDKPDSKGTIVNPGDVSLTSMLKAKKLSLSSNWKLLGTTPLRRSLWKSINGYDPAFKSDDLHDVEFWIRALASGCKYFYISDTIYIWRKYLGSNSRQVTPASWVRIAETYFSVYQELELSYRAYEIFLLNSKWNDNRKEIKQYSKELKECIGLGRFQLSSLVILAIPSKVFQFLTRYAMKFR